MAEPIELGLILSGQDRVDFEEYLKNPTCTEEGLKLLREAEELANT
ncbi:MAG: hypothetical protein LDL35_06580 [Methanospirillum hungatei]|nr:hypothetical protein [Methanospirillum hungatei]